MADEVLVLGAGFAGINAALSLSRKGFDVTVVDLNEYHEYRPDAINLFRDRFPEQRARVALEGFFEGTDIEFVQEVVEGINPENKVVHTSSGEYLYDNIVVALGGEPDTHGLDISKAYTMYGLEDAKIIKDNLEDVEEVLVIGSGYLGVEIAGELSETEVDVTIVDRSTRPLPGFPEEASHIALDYMNHHEISFRGGKEITEITEDGIKTEDDEEIDADMVIWTGRLQPTEVVRDSFNLDEGEAIPVNQGLCSKKYDDVFAAGVCAGDNSWDKIGNAVKQGGVVAENMGKEENEDLQAYMPKRHLYIISLGKTGVVVYGKRAFEHWTFRYLKDLVRIKYFLGLKMKKLRASIAHRL